MDFGPTTGGKPCQTTCFRACWSCLGTPWTPGELGRAKAPVFPRKAGGHLVFCEVHLAGCRIKRKGDRLDMPEQATKPKTPPGRRKKKPKILAYITEACTGCAGAPVCQSYCPVDECMVLVQNPGAATFGVIEVNPFACIGCKK